jgi:soluble lytic murein transglycosylase-like protein
VALLAVVGCVAAWLAIAVRSPVAAPVARAAAPAAASVTHNVSVALHTHIHPRCPLPTSLRPAFVNASRRAHVSLGLLYAVGRVESNLRQDASSSAGARGLLQVMPATARALDLDVDEPSSNVLAGARYLRELINRFHSVDLGLAAYNAGPTAVQRAGMAPSIDVLRYVANVDLIWHAVAGCR